MQKSVQGAELTSQAGSELSYRFPFSASNQFPTLFDAIENDKKNLGVSDYGISVTTLEEVFLRVSAEYIQLDICSFLVGWKQSCSRWGDCSGEYGT